MWENIRITKLVLFKVYLAFENKLINLALYDK